METRMRQLPEFHTDARFAGWWQRQQIARRYWVPHTPVLRVRVSTNLMLNVGEIGKDFVAAEPHPETGLYYYRARYYDTNVGRFLSEDTVGFGGGENFYRYVYNHPSGLTDPTGLSAADVQRIQAACKRCTQSLTDSGLRMDGGSGDTPLGAIGALVIGGINDFRSGFSNLKKQACKSQAIMTKPCLDDPAFPLDDHWSFPVLPIWNGYHWVIRAISQNPSDPDVICDPWLNRSFTTPKQTWPKGTGGKK
jgi:RHS repeat-associated protein